MNYKNKLILIILIFQALCFSSCSKIYKKILNPSDHAGQNNANSNDYFASNSKSTMDADIGGQLINAAKSIEKSLATLAAAQEINNIPVLNTAPLLTPEGGMGGTADIDWTGPLEPLLEKIASMTEYKLKILGSKPAIPIIVSVTQNHAIIADILKNASLQAGKRVNVVVFPANKIIELRYRFGPYESSLPNNDQSKYSNKPSISHTINDKKHD